MERMKNWHLFDRTIPITMASTVSDAWIGNSKIDTKENNGIGV